MNTGLIMEGGAMRGMFTCGVLDVFMENHITFKGAAGISAGAVFGCNFKSRQIGRALRYNKKYGSDPRYCSIRSWLKTGDLYGVDFCYRMLPNVLDPFDRKEFAANPMEFYVGATDVLTGKIVYHLCTDGGEADMKWFQASASMPVVSKPVSVGKRLLMDGGIAESVPCSIMRKRGYERNVLILTQAKGYRKEKTSSIVRLMLRKYPKLAEAMSTRHDRYNRQMDDIDREEASGSILVIRPQRSLGLKRTESRPEELERVYQIGRNEAMKKLDEVRAFLNEDKKAEKI